MKKRGILVTSYGGLTPIARFPGGVVDPILSRVGHRLGTTCGKPVSEAQVLHLWLRKKEVPYVTYAPYSHCNCADADTTAHLVQPQMWAECLSTWTHVVYQRSRMRRNDR